MPAPANNFATRRGANAQLPTAIKVVLTLLLSTLFLALVVASDRHAGESTAQSINNLPAETQR